MNHSTPAPVPHYPQDVYQYFELNEWHRVKQNLVSDVVIFCKGNKAIVMHGDAIEVRQPKSGPYVISGATVLLDWVAKKHYRGWDGKNVFEMMMLLSFMGAITIDTVKQEIRKQAMADAMQVFYPGVLVSNVPNMPAHANY